MLKGSGFHKQSEILLWALQFDLQGSGKNQKSWYLKRNLQRVFPAGILEKGLGGMKRQSFLASSCFPEAKKMEKKDGEGEGMMFALLLTFALQNVFICAGGKVCYKIFAVGYVSWLTRLRTGLKQEYQTDTAVWRCIPRALQGPRDRTAAAEGQQRQHPTAFQFW